MIMTLNWRIGTRIVLIKDYEISYVESFDIKKFDIFLKNRANRYVRIGGGF